MSDPSTRPSGRKRPLGVPMKCRVCREPAQVKAARHNAAFCASHFREHFLRQVTRALDRFGMLRPGERVLLGVSGGKDSVVAWRCLVDLGYTIEAVHLNHGFGEYSRASEAVVRRFADGAGLPLRVFAFQDLMGFPFEEAVRHTTRPPCALCGSVKRYWMNRLALELECGVVATGHNLDDEAALLLGNVLHWQMGYLRTQHPVLEAEEGLVRKVKPLFRVTDEETRRFAELGGLEFIERACPYAHGSTTHFYKEILEQVEKRAPNIKSGFYFGFLERLLPAFSEEFRDPHRVPGRCRSCGYKTLRGELCYVCAPRAPVCALRARVCAPPRARETGAGEEDGGCSL